LVLLLVLSVCSNLAVHAQNNAKLLGMVKDTTNAGIPGANVRLIAGQDTLSTSTDSAGRFGFTIYKGNVLFLLVRSIGYLSYSTSYTLKDGISLLQLPGIVLKSAAQQLKEVRIKGKVPPIRVMKDTVEYNASAYAVHEQDKVEDLLKQMPGIIVDANGSVTTEGTPLTKIRVNGKDFFTGDVKEFISKLPAGLVEKIQVIDDYGDQANFTGVKTGEPQKLLNVVFKPNHNGGKFGDLTASAGTNDRYGLSLNDYFWEDTKQIGINGNGVNLNNGAGINTNANLGMNYRNTVAKDLILSGGYNYSYNRTATNQQSYTQTVNPLGTIYNQSDNESGSKGNNNNLYLNLQSLKDRTMIQGNINGTLAGNTANSLSASQQTGLIRQDLNTMSNSDTHNPTINAGFNVNRKLKKKNRQISLAITASSTKSNNNNYQNNEIGYFDPSTGNPIKDSLFNQLIDTRTHNQTLTTKISYTEPVGHQKDSLIKKVIDFSYRFSLTHNSNELETSAIDPGGSINKVDSLSNSYSSTFFQHTIAANYRYDSRKLNYTIGANVQPYLLTGGYEGRADRIDRPGFTFFPVARLNYKPSPDNVFSFYYTENTIIPNFSQLQPIPDTRNLQDVIIGNPDLKAALSHVLNFNYRHVNASNGSSVLVGIGANATQNQVVSNTILIPDTLKSLRQETRYQNVNGNYTVNGNYWWSLPLDKNKYSITVRGTLAYDHHLSFSNGMENFSEGINLSQSAGLRINEKWLMLNTNFTYNLRDNTYSLATAIPNKIQTWTFNADTRIYLSTRLSVAATAIKTINAGYNLPGANTLIMGGYVEKIFLKNKQISVKIEANDVLNQGNNLNRTISDNTITESKTNQISRYFMLSLSWRLQDFNGKS